MPEVLRERLLKIAYLEDDIDQGEIVVTWLQDAGFDITLFDRGQKLISAIKSERYEMLLLDWGVPDLDGMSVLKWARQNIDSSLPTIFLTARDAEEDVVEALDAGADDYLAKPLNAAVTVARVNALARRIGFGADEPGPKQVGTITYDKASQKMVVDDEAVKLTHREFELAVYLLENVGRLLPRAAILKEIWGLNDNVQTRTLDTHISRIKKKLGLFPVHGWSLRSIYHQGYRLEMLEPTTGEQSA